MAEKIIARINNKKYGYGCDECHIVGKEVFQTAKRMLCKKCAEKESLGTEEELSAMEKED
jgi:uncharacterized hydantoinase/oxoprolinase family protein